MENEKKKNDINYLSGLDFIKKQSKKQEVDISVLIGYFNMTTLHCIDEKIDRYITERIESDKVIAGILDDFSKRFIVVQQDPTAVSRLNQVLERIKLLEDVNVVLTNRVNGLLKP